MHDIPILLPSSTQRIVSAEKPKILVVADRPLWAYHYIQRFIAKSISMHYDVYTDYISNYPLQPATTLKAMISRSIHKTRYCRFRRILKPSDTYDIAVLLGFYFARSSQLHFRARHVVKGIFTDGFPPNGVDEYEQSITTAGFVEKYLSDATAVVCGSKMIEARFKGLHPFVCYANGALSAKQFRRATPKIKNDSTRFIVGWTGKPTRNFKGFYDYVVPAVEGAARLRPGIKLKTRFKGPMATLPEFYSDVDVLLIASSADAGPSLFSEGGLCDVPSISTRIGFPNEVIRHGENGLLVDRNAQEMCNALVRLYDDRDLLYKMSLQIRSDVELQLGESANRTRWLELFARLIALPDT